MAQPQSQQDLLKFQGKRIKDQSESIAEQSKKIAEWITQQQDPRHNQERMNRKQHKALKETFVTVFTGLVINWPISLGLLYLCWDVIGLNTLETSIVMTLGMTLVALLRVFTIRMYYEE